MKSFIYWLAAFLITVGAGFYQRTTGPTYPKKEVVTVNERKYTVELDRGLSLNQPSEVKLAIADSTVTARLWYRRYPTKEDFTSGDFIFRDTRRFKGFAAAIPQQPAAGKLQYYFEITDSKGTKVYLRDNPVIVRFKGAVPAYILIPHILLMFVAMLFSTLAGLMAIGKNPGFRKYTNWTLILFTVGGLFLGPVVQYMAFGDLWTGIPFGWDLTDNKTLIAFVFWVLAVVMNWKKRGRFILQLLQ